MSEYDKLVRTARYSPTTVGNMVLDKNGAYCSIEAIEQLDRHLADRDAEIAKLIEAVADHVTVRSEQYAELQKYRDAPVVAYMHPHGGLLHKPSTGLERETYTINLIVKPGE